MSDILVGIKFNHAVQGRTGRAYLFNSVVNVTLGPTEERILNTGLHKVHFFFVVVMAAPLILTHLFRFRTFIAIAATATWVGDTRKHLSKAKSIRKTKLSLKRQG